MDVKELRTGNYVGISKNARTLIEEDKQGFIKVFSIGSGSVNQWNEMGTSGGINNPKPIPLTENWLLDFGFNIIKGWDDTFYFERSGFQIYEYSVSGYEYDGFSIKYVHQLQNLHFALTNQELTNK